MSSALAGETSSATTRADRRVDQAGRRLRQQGLDLAPQRGIVRARAREKRVALGRRPLARLVKQPFDLAQALRRHIYGFPGAIVPQVVEEVEDEHDLVLDDAALVLGRERPRAACRPDGDRTRLLPAPSTANARRRPELRLVGAE